MTKTAAPQLKELLRSRLPPIFNALKSTFVFLETAEVANALKSIDRMKEIPLAKLSDVDYLENFIISSGLHTSGRDGSYDSIEYEWPRSLDAFVGKGLQIWQYPTQFSKYFVFLSQFPIKSNLEVGVAYGGAFVFSAEYLKRYNPLLMSYCIDVVSPSVLVKSYSRKRNFSYITAERFSFYQRIDSQTNFDLVFIDGDHSKEGVSRDFELSKDKADIVAFHDSVNFKTFGAIDEWDRVKNHVGNDADFFEFTDQYAEILNKQPDNRLFGIGVAVKKDPSVPSPYRSPPRKGVKPKLITLRAIVGKEFVEMCRLSQCPCLTRPLLPPYP